MIGTPSALISCVSGLVSLVVQNNAAPETGVTASIEQIEVVDKKLRRDGCDQDKECRKQGILGSSSRRGNVGSYSPITFVANSTAAITILVS